MQLLKSLGASTTCFRVPSQSINIMKSPLTKKPGANTYTNIPFQKWPFLYPKRNPDYQRK